MSNHDHGAQPVILPPTEAWGVIKSLLSPTTYLKFAKEHPILSLILVLGAIVTVNRFLIGGLARPPTWTTTTPGAFGSASTSSAVLLWPLAGTPPPAPP